MALAQGQCRTRRKDETVASVAEQSSVKSSLDELSIDQPIPTVNVRSEVRSAVVGYPNRLIRDVQRKRFLKINTEFITGREQHFKQRVRTVRLHAQQKAGKIVRPVNPNASMAEGAHLSLKECAPRRVMQIDVELVGEHELDSAQRIVGSGGLTHLERKIAGCELAEVQLGSADQVPGFGFEDNQLRFGHWILFEFWQNLTG